VQHVERLLEIHNVTPRLLSLALPSPLLRFPVLCFPLAAFALVFIESGAVFATV
jgi:hypothetical protein